MKKMEENPEKKKLIIRIVLFAIVFIVAVLAITNGVLQIGRKKTGFTEITEAADEEAILYGSDYKLMYYASGSQAEIKELCNKVSADYSRILQELYKLTDPRKEYEDMVNLATLNRRPGEKLEIPELLFNILEDALRKTQEGKGYSVFSGVFYDEWNTILMLDEPLEYEPLLNSEQKARFEQINAFRDIEGTFSLELDQTKKTAVFAFSGEYRDLRSELESDAPVLDLGLLREAYVAENVIRELEKLGYHDGYLETAGGLTVCMSENSRGYTSFYGKNGDKNSLCALYPAKGGRACSFFRLFPLQEEEYGFYQLPEKDGGWLRGPYIAAFCDPSGLLSSSLTVKEDGCAADAVYENLKLYTYSDPEALLRTVQSSNVPTVLTLFGENGKVYGNRAADQFTEVRGSGWTAEILK